MVVGNPHEQAQTDKKGKIENAWEKTKEGAESVKDKTVEESKNLADAVKSGWENTKEGVGGAVDWTAWHTLGLADSVITRSEKSKEGAADVKAKFARDIRDEDDSDN